MTIKQLKEQVKKNEDIIKYQQKLICKMDTFLLELTAIMKEDIKIINKRFENLEKLHNINYNSIHFLAKGIYILKFTQEKLTKNFFIRSYIVSKLSIVYKLYTLIS